MNITKAQLINEQLKTKLNEYNQIKYIIPQRPSPIDQNSPLSTRLTHALSLYNYLWSVNLFDEASQVIREFFDGLSRDDFHFEQ